MMNTNLMARYVNPQCGYAPPQDLELNQAYPVSEVSMGGWHTDIFLVGKDKAYNSVNFVFEENGKEVNIYADARFNPYM